MIFLFLLLFWLNGWAQSEKNTSYLITYSFELQEFESDPSSVRKGEAILFSYGDSSVFMDRAQYVIDSITNASNYRALDKTERSRMILSRSRPVFRYSVFKDYVNYTVIYREPVNGSSFSYTEQLPEVNWDILKDTATISQYLCQKAVGKFAGRTYEAWFSTQIPIHDGPYKLGGLPGLIFKLEDDEGKIKYKLTGIESVGPNDSLKFKRGIRVSKKEFQERKNHYFTNRGEYRTNTGTRRIIADGKEESLEEFYEGIKQEYLDRVRIEVE